jgi:hypothetical protein
MWDSHDQKKQSIRYAENFSSAIRANGVKNAVFLSSYGAHRLDDAGAISGMGLAEVVLNKLDGVNVLSLRAGYFYSNLLLSLDLVKTAGHMGNMFVIPDGTFTMVDPDDIACVAAEALDKLNFKGHSPCLRDQRSDRYGRDRVTDRQGDRHSRSQMGQVPGRGFQEGAPQLRLRRWRSQRLCGDVRHPRYRSSF